MTLSRLHVENVRCIQTAGLEFDAARNLITGPNASGKTTLLEAIYFLGRARSFRSSRSQTLVRNGTEGLTTVGYLSQSHRERILGLRFGRGGLEARLDGRAVSGIAELATTFPVQAIDPELHQLIEEGPQQRRRYLDWGVFHVEPAFVGAWQRFQRALRQRNAALRDESAEDLVRAFDGELTEAGLAVAQARSRYLTALGPFVSAAGERLLGHPLDLVLAQGWPVERSLQEALERSWARDRARGATQVGPHRADLQIRVGGHVARDRVSRGQQKLVAAAMLIGQLKCDAAQGSPTAALLVDDPAAELDPRSLEGLLDEILALPLQLFVTALDGAHRALQRLESPAKFHVEHGKVTRLL
jgi:DNA replication and repair protein RecF